MKTTSRLHVITNNTVEKTVPDKRYEDFHGSTRNDMLSLVTLPAYDLMWNVTVKEKQALYSHSDGNRRIASPEVRAYNKSIINLMQPKLNKHRAKFISFIYVI